MVNLKKNNYNRIVSLDGLRAISVFLVILEHAGNALPLGIRNSYFYTIISRGHTGVMLFFLISGFIITKKLSELKSEKSSLHLFYYKRIKKIFPIFYLYILVIILLDYLFKQSVFSRIESIFISSSLLWNYKFLFFDHWDSKELWFFGHFWSLNIEEQFYIFYPLLFFYSKHKYLIITLIIIFSPLMRVISYFYFPESRGYLDLMFHTGIDTILTGCLGWKLYNTPKYNVLINKGIKNYLFIFLCFIFVFLIDPYLISLFHGKYTATIGTSFKNIALLFLIFYSLKCNNLVSYILNSRILVYIGLASYSIYVWQQLITQNVLDNYLLFPFNVLFSIVIGIISFEFIERKITKIKTFGRNN